MKKIKFNLKKMAMLIACILSILFIFSNCKKEKSSENEILSFCIIPPYSVGIINETTKAITVEVPECTDVTMLASVINVSKKATVSPASEVIQNFTHPVVYTVTAEDGTVAKYTVRVTIEKSSENKILSFCIITPYSVGVINETTKVITVEVSENNDITALVPTITVSPKAIVSPMAGVAQNFTNSVTYTVTAENGNTADYSIKVTKREDATSNVIEAKNVQNSSSKIATVEAQAFYYVGDDFYYETIASCSYENRGFKIILPQTLDDKYLEIFDYESDFVVISDKNAKIGQVDLDALDNTGVKIGFFYLAKSGTTDYYEAMYLYADRNFTLKGKEEGNDEGYPWSVEYNCSFKKGWNIIYICEVNMGSGEVAITITTKKPSENWVWAFYSWGDWDKKAKSTHNIKSIKGLKKNFLQ